MLKRELFRIALLVFLCSTIDVSYAQTDIRALYNISVPVLTEIYVSPTGSDGSSGASREQALQSLTEAWNRIPVGETLWDTGYHIWLLPGTYPTEIVPHYWESRYGTFEHPIIIEAADGPNSVYLPNLNIYDTRYLYLINLNIEPGTDAFHCERCDHLLLRGTRMVGAEPDSYNSQETVKVNQSQYVYVENNDISGAWDNAVDFVAVKYGHFIGNRIHNAGDWCMYLKGGSAYFRVEANEFFDCGTGGFTAGQGTGFQFMVAPWIQYEAYDVKFVNNIVHDTRGAGVGVQGGYNILIAYNTFYRVGENSHALEIGFGSRSCDGQPGDEGRAACDSYRAANGWGNNLLADGVNYVRIPNRSVFVYNNVLYNPPGFQSQYQQFSIFAPYSEATQNDSNVSVPTLSDDNLQIRGNIIWNGGADMPLGVESDPDSPAGCQPDNPTCNEAQLRADNAINTLKPVLIDPANGNFQLAAGVHVPTHPIPDFIWEVSAPPGELSNAVSHDFDGQARSSPDIPGAFATK